MSQRYLSSPNWKNLLKSFTHKLQPNNSYSWQCYKNQAEERIQEMGWSSNSLYPYIATLIRKEYNRKFFEDPSFEKELKESITDQEKVTDPFKFAVADYLQKTVQETETLHIEADKLLNLDSRVSNFITTNYDLFLETMFPRYKVLKGQDEALNFPILPVGNIYKIHGSISDPRSIILTKEDYDRFNERARFLSSKLLTMFVENPVIFLGYSISDPDIMKILSDISLCLSEENRKQFREKMIFIEFSQDGKESIIEKSISGIDMTVIKLEKYQALFESFDYITDRIDVGTLRKIQSMIHELVETSRPTVLNVHLVGLDDPNLESSELAISIADQSRMSPEGYFTPCLTDICEDVLFGNRMYDPDKLLNVGILKNKGKFNTSKIPLRGYMKRLGLSELDPWLQSKMISCCEDLYSRTEKKNIDKHGYTYKEISEITETFANFEEIINRIFFSLQSLPVDEVERYIKSNWGRLRELGQKTRLTKTVCYIDLIKNR